MQPNSFKLTGTKESLEKLRQDLRAEPQGAQIIVSDLTPAPAPPGSDAVRVRDPITQHDVMMLAFHIPIGLVTHGLYDWLRGWLRTRSDAAQVRVEEMSVPTPPSGPSTPEH